MVAGFDYGTHQGETFIMNEVAIGVIKNGCPPGMTTGISIGMVSIDSPEDSLLVHVGAKGVFEGVDTLPPVEACNKIEEYLERVFGGVDVIPVAHNVGLDMEFLRSLAKKGGRNQLRFLSKFSVDLHTLFYTIRTYGGCPPSSGSLTEALEYYVIDMPEDALSLSLANRELYLKVLETVR